MAVAFAAKYLANPRMKVGNVSHGVIEQLGIGLVVLDSPSRTNALSGSMMLQLGAVAAAYSGNLNGPTTAMDSVRAVVLVGAGRHFCAGADLASMMEDATGKCMNTYMQSITHALSHSVAPVTIAAVHGAAFGGGAELASAADLRIGGPSTRAAFVQARMGLSTGWGGTHALRDAVGRSAALRLLLSTAPHNADELFAMRWLDDCASAQDMQQGSRNKLGEHTHISTEDWSSAVAAGAPQLETHQARGGNAQQAGQHTQLAEVLQEHPPAQLDTSVLSTDAVGLLHYIAERYAMPARSAMLARAPKAILNSKDPLATEREVFGQLWRGDAHNAALNEARR